MGRQTKWIRKGLRWAAIGTVGTGSALGLFLREDGDGGEGGLSKRCIDRVAFALNAGLDPTEALTAIGHARTDLERRRAAHERALGQLRRDPLWADVEQRKWLQGAVDDEQTMLVEIDEADSGLEDAESCLESGELP